MHNSEQISGPKTISREEMMKAAELITEVDKELKAGFKFLERYPQSATFFGSSEFKADNPYCKDAYNLAHKIVSELGYSVISGGGPGIMQAANQGAYDAGGKSLGITIDIPVGQTTNGYLTEHIDLYYFFIRKVCLSYSAEAFIFYPGGFGTLDEFFELATLFQTQKIKGSPIICVGSDFWNSVKAFIEKELLGRAAIDVKDLDLFTITDDHDEIIDIIRKSKPELPSNRVMSKETIAA